MEDVSSSTRDGLQVLGLCRFSVPMLTGFKKNAHDLEDRRAALYAPDRLELRFALFEHLLLPSIAAQKDKAFRLIILMGADFPEPWRGRMEAHVAAYPQLVTEYVEPDLYRPLCRRVMTEHIDPAADAVAQFRIDDDDAVAVDFSRRLRRDFRRLRGIFAENGGVMALDYSRGFYVEVLNGQVRYRAKTQPMLGVALTMIHTPGDGHCVYDHMHHQLPGHMATVMLRDTPMYLRGVHDNNDSRVNEWRKSKGLLGDDARKQMRERFRHDTKAFAAEMARLHAAGIDI